MEPGTIITTTLFLILTTGIGYSALLLVKPKPWADTILLSLAVGLGVLPLVIILLRVLHIPLDIRILTALAIIGPAVAVFRRRAPTGAVSASRYAVIGVVVIVAIVITALMYIGATKYPYLEDDDPWGYATAAHYVALERTTAQPEGTSHYLEPYPPYFSALMGMLHQTNKDLQWVLKFFNAALIGISIIAAFYAFEALSNDSFKAGAGAVMLGFIPAYMSHFIWSQSLAIPVFLIALWALASIEPPEGKSAAERNPKKDFKRALKDLYKSEHLWLAVLLVWSATIIQPSTAAVFAILFVLFGIIVVAAGWIAERRIPVGQAAAVILGGALSFITWLGFVLVYGWERVAEIIGVRSDIFVQGSATDTSGGIVYGLRDIIFAPSSSKIDQATGLGLAVSILALLAIVLFIINWRKLGHQRNKARIFMVAWLVVAILGIEGNALPYKLFPHRFWVFLAIVVAYLAAETIVILANAAKQRWLRAGIVAAIVLVVVATSVGPRLAVQHAQWPPGVLWTSNEEIMTYVQLSSSLPAQTGVFALCTSDDRLIGMNLHSRPWSEELRSIKRDVSALDSTRLADFMGKNGYEYVVIDTNCVNKIGMNATEDLLMDMQESGRFAPAAQNPGILVMRLQR